MNHPEGRLLAIQQQIFFARLLGKHMEINEEIVLQKLALAGLGLSMDVNEIALDAAAILPSLNNEKTKLRAVPNEGVAK